MLDCADKPLWEGNMKLPRREFLQLAAGAAALTVLVTLADQGAWSQATRTIKIVVGAAPGGSTDITARLMAEVIGRAQGVTMVVENRPGAGGIVGTEAVARAAPDGNTLLMISNAFLVDAQLRKVSYHPVASFEPISLLVESPPVLVVNAASPYRSLADLLAAARAKPGALTMASVGPLNQYQIGLLTLTRVANVNMTYVPYPGSAPAVNAILGDHVTTVIAGIAVVEEQIKAGKLRGIVAATAKRIASLPDVPTFSEAGFKDLEVDNWFGIVAPAKTPKATLTQFGGWFTAALRAPEVSAKLLAQGLYPIGMGGDDFGALIRKRFDEYGRAIRDVNLKTE
jgi:tripartite-type tricarboxylate transporter receptor subunit TctC